MSSPAPVNEEHPLVDFFSWRGRLGRSEYFQRLTMATLIFMMGLYLQFSNEPAFSRALGLTEESPWHPLYFVPLLAELVGAFGNPMTLPAFILTGIISADPAPASAAMGDSHPALCIFLFAAANLLLFVSGFWSLALTMRRLRDAGTSPKRLAAWFSVFVPLSFLMSFEEAPFISLLILPFLAWMIVWLIVQWRAVLRPALPKIPS